MSNTLLSLVQQFCRVTGLAVPTTVTGSSDPQIIQIVGLVNEGLNDLVSFYDWPELKRFSSFLTVGALSQGKLSALAPGYVRFVKDTIWNSSQRLPAIGAVTGAESQSIKQLGTSTYRNIWRIFGDEFQFTVIPAIGEQITFEYITDLAVLSSLNVPQNSFIADSDTCLLPVRFLSLDLRWRWRKEKEMNYAEDFRTYQFQVSQFFRDKQQARTLHLGNDPLSNNLIGVVVPYRNWGIP